MERMMNMSKYREVSANMNFVEREKATEQFWKDNDIFKKSMENRREGRHTPFMTGLPRQTESLILGMC